MAKFVLTNAKVLFEGRDLSGELSNVDLQYSCETPDSTTFGDITRRRLPGLLDVAATQSGYWDSVSTSDSADKDMFEEVAATSGLMTMSDSGGTLGDVSFAFKTQTATYSPGGAIGEVFAFQLQINGDGVLSRGSVVENSVFTFVGVTQGTSLQKGAAASPDTTTSTLHVTAASGTTPTLDVTVDSDDADASPFASGVTRLTHPQMTTVGANQQTLVGAVTDDWWRYVITIGGTTPSFTIFGSLAIQQTVLP